MRGKSQGIFLKLFNFLRKIKRIPEKISRKSKFLRYYVLS
nr:MAG TPA: hypothetical protein [Bacteriophage sp.]